jgi:hypothetical protein
MSAISFRAAAGFLSLFLMAASLPAQNTAASAPSPGMSKVRIVRLSVVRGTVQVQQGAGLSFGPAMMNLPIVESDRIRTGIGIAEVEFEDQSTLRLATNTEVDFPELERAASGTTVTAVRVLKGMVYVSLIKKHAGDFTLEFGSQKNFRELPLPAASHIRLQVSETGAQLAVLGGSVAVKGVNGPIDVPSKRTVSFTSADTNPAITKNIVAESFDRWDQQSAQYHARSANLSAFRNAPYSYGLNDLAYYGAFSNAGGCGTMWYPYFAGASWNPYGNGAWAWYQGAGYSWVSPYPWGWLPYHYGSWSYCPGTGWGWMPYGTWNGLNNAPTTPLPCARSGPGCRTHPLPPPPKRPPLRGASKVIKVNRTPLVTSGVGAKGSFLFVRGSAGLGIPREGLGKLGGFSRNSVRRGVAATPVYLFLDSGERSGRAAAGDFAPVAVHRGYAPRPMPDRGFGARGYNNGNAGGAWGNAMSSGASMGSSAPATSMRSSVGAMHR